jgi:protein-tyrosine phosphatase
MKLKLFGRKQTVSLGKYPLYQRRILFPMKYGLLFLALALLLAGVAGSRGGWYLLILWPAISLAIVASGYLGLGPRVFGKRPDGTISPLHILLLLPYFVPLWTLWLVARSFRREQPYHELTENILFGRRLMPHEVPEGIDHVIDLTCEFSEPHRLRELSYFSFPILDASAASEEQLQEWLALTVELEGTVYIHCAEGRGRTGMFAAALMLHMGRVRSVDEAVSLVATQRPHVQLNAQQKACLERLQFEN